MTEPSYFEIITEQKKNRKRKFIHYFTLAGMVITAISAIIALYHRIHLGVSVALSLCVIMSIIFLVNLKIYREEVTELYIIFLNLAIGIGVWLVGREAFMSIFYTSMFLAIGLLLDNKHPLKILFHFCFTIFFAFLTYYVEIPFYKVQKPTIEEANISQKYEFYSV